MSRIRAIKSENKRTTSFAARFFSSRGVPAPSVFLNKVQAQQQEASAENDYISGLFSLNLARLTLARATGDAETEVSSLFPGEKH